MTRLCLLLCLIFSVFPAYAAAPLETHQFQLGHVRHPFCFVHLLGEKQPHLYVKTRLPAGLVRAFAKADDQVVEPMLGDLRTWSIPVELADTPKYNNVVVFPMNILMHAKQSVVFGFTLTNGTQQVVRFDSKRLHQLQQALL